MLARPWPRVAFPRIPPPYTAQATPSAHLVLGPKYSRRIMCACSLMLGSIGSALWNGLADNMLLAALVLATSVNYWRFPVDGVRRRLDMACANFAFMYQLLYSSRSAPPSAQLAYFVTVVVGGAFYLGARHYGRGRGDHDSASKCHVCLHVVGNVGNVLLYDALGHRRLGW